MSSLLRRKKVAFLSGPALGHVSRLNRVAQHLESLCDADICFVLPAFSGYQDLPRQSGFRVLPVPVEQAARLFPAETFAAGAEAHLEEIAPDLIVTDMCPLRWLSVLRFPGCPRVKITNFFLTGAYDAPTFQRKWFADIGAEVAQMRRARGLPPLSSVFDLYEADAVLLADPPALVEAATGALPSHYALCGPVFDRSEGALPDTLASAKELLLMSMGSTGLPLAGAALIEALKGWSGSDMSVYVGSQAEAVRTAGIADQIHSWLPLSALLGKCRFVVTQGGAGSTYMALAAGVPVGVIPTHANHAILGELVAQAGLGLSLTGKGDLASLVDVSYPALLERARAFAEGSVEGAEVMAGKIAELLE